MCLPCRILLERRQANDAIELLRVLTRRQDLSLEIHPRNLGHSDGELDAVVHLQQKTEHSAECHGEQCGAEGGS